MGVPETYVSGNQLSLANINNKHITMKETKSLQIKVIGIKHLWKNLPARNSVNGIVVLEHFN